MIKHLAAVVTAIIVSVTSAGARAADRAPVWAGKFYPADRAALADAIEGFTRRARAHRPELPALGGLRALILPHAGYAYSGQVAAYAWHVLNQARFDKVILMGPDHRVGFSNAAVSDADAWVTPLGRVPLHPDARHLCRGNDDFRPIAASDAGEHCLEVILPFLQTYLKDFQLVPVVLGPCDCRQVARAIEPIVDSTTLMVVSSDLSHFLAYDQAVAKDKATIAAIMALNQDAILDADNSACGRYPVAVLLDLARRHGWQPVLLHYANSGDTAGDRGRVVGYAAVAFFGEQPMPSSSMSHNMISAEQGQILVTLARQTIMTRFNQAIAPGDAARMEECLRDQALQAQCGTFVTLKKGGQLRGCIGSLVGREPIVEGVRTNALNAAFHDPRFRPLTAKELDQVSIEVSILTAPQALEYDGAEDLVAKLRPRVDGVTIRKGFSSATFLPQVWEQLPDAREFLSHLCLKAGMAGDAWRQGDLQVETYQVQHFEEPH